MWVQAALDEALEQPQRDDGVLARALPEAQDPLVALVVHTERREDVVAAELDAVDVDDQIVPVVQFPLRQLLEALARRLSRLTAHRGLADARCLGHLPDRLAVGPRAQAGQQQFKHSLPESRRPPERLVRRDREFALAGAAQPGPLDPDGPVRQVHPAPLPPVVRRAPALPLLPRLLLSRDIGGADIQHRLDRRAPDHVDDVIQRASRQREDIDQRE